MYKYRITFEYDIDENELEQDYCDYDIEDFTPAGGEWTEQDFIRHYNIDVDEDDIVHFSNIFFLGYDETSDGYMEDIEIETEEEIENPQEFAEILVDDIFSIDCGSIKVHYVGFNYEPYWTGYGPSERKVNLDFYETYYLGYKNVTIKRIN